MSAEAASDIDRSGFSPRAVLALVLVGVVALSGIAVLGAFAPDLRGGLDGRAHALSNSAVGYKAAVVLARSLDMPVVVSRTRITPQEAEHSALVLTPVRGTDPKALAAIVTTPALIVIPKWAVSPKPERPGFVENLGAETAHQAFGEMLKPFAPETVIVNDKGTARTALHGGGATFSAGTFLPLAPIPALQTISGKGWRPALVDDRGRAVLVESAARPGLFVLSEPDLLNTQGLKSLDNARAGMAILQTLRAPDHGLVFDVTLDGYQRGRGLWRTLLTPPWLAATLCGAAAALLMGLHALARFGPATPRGRAVALGASALVESSAGLVRMARREAELTPAYGELVKDQVLRAAGHRSGAGRDPGPWLAALARARGAEPPDQLTAEAAAARDRGDALIVAARLYRWRGEMTRERR